MSTRLTASVLLASLTLSLPALAEVDQRQRAPEGAAPIAKREPVNAALRYWPQWAMLEVGFAKFPGADLAKAFTGDTSEQAVEGEALVLNQSDVIPQLIDASRQPKVDWGIAVELGPGALMPHLSPLRRSAWLLLADARRLIQNGDGGAAAERIAGVVRMAGHVSAGDEFLISSLVSMSVFEAAAREANTALDSGALNPEAQRTIVGVLDRFPLNDPFGASASIQEEGRVFSAWLRAEVASSDPKRHDEVVLMFANTANDDNESMRIVRDLLERGEPLDSYFWLLEKAYKEADAAWTAPNADEALAALGDRIGAGEFGPIAQVFFPALNRIKSSDTKAQATLTALRARLAQP